MSRDSRRLGGIAQFFFEHGQLRFDVQLASARRARLQISSKLLTLATSKMTFSITTLAAALVVTLALSGSASAQVAAATI